MIAVYGDSFLNIAHQSLTAAIVTLSVFGALTAYVISMASLFRLRRSEPEMARPYRAPLFPVAPGLALILALVCLVAMAWLNPEIFAVFAAILLGGYGLYRLMVRPVPVPAPAGG